MRIRYSTPALNQLANILSYIAEESPAGARNVSKAIERAAGLAAFMPKLGHPVPHRRDALAIIARPYPYRVTYRVQGSVLEVLAISHTARAHKD